MNRDSIRTGLVKPILALGLLLAACGPAATSTPTLAPPPTETPVPSDTPAPTETPIPTDTPVPPTDTPVPPTETPIPPTDTPRPTATPTPGPGDIVYQTEFDDLEGWITLAFKYTDGAKVTDFTAEAQGGALYIEVPVEETSVYAVYDLDWSRADVRIEADVATVAGPNRNNIALVCRLNERGWYEFAIESSGLWQIYKYEEEGDGFTLLADGGSTAINVQRASNHIAVECRGDQLTLIVNDVEVASITNSQFTRGSFGVSVSTFDLTGAGVEFDHLVVTIPEEAE